MFPDEAIALRLRRICNQLNLQNAVPDDNNELYRSMFSVLGMIARKLDKTNAPTVDREGWVSVPIEPTEEMIQDGYTALMEWDARTGEDIGMGDVYKAMIQAAPTDKE